MESELNNQEIMEIEMENILSNQEIKEKYKAFSKYYDIVEGIGDRIIGKYRKEILSSVKGNILETGIGTGANLEYYGDKCDVIGLDFTKEMIDIAREKADKLDINVRFIIGNVEKLPFENEKFDYVVDSLGLCTYVNVEKVLREMSRVCKKKGRILLLEHGASNNVFIRKLQEWREEKHYSKLGCSLMREHIEIVEKSGLRILRERRVMFGMIYLIEAR